MPHQPNNRWVLRTAIYAGLLLVALVIDRPSFLDEVVSYFLGESCHPREISALAPPAYNSLLRLASPFQEVRVAVVTFNRNSEPQALMGNDYCQKRLFTARLIGQIEKLGASSIVLDENYDPSRCVLPSPSVPSVKPNGTQELLQALSDARKPITFAVDSDEVGDRAAESKEIKACLVMDESALKAVECQAGQKGPCPKEAQDRLNEDTRRIPMKWQLFATKADSESKNAVPLLRFSLSLQAALQENPNLINQKPLADLIDEEDPVHPFTSFREEGEIPIYPARQVLCGVNFPPQFAGDWQSACKEPAVEAFDAQAAKSAALFSTGLSDERIYKDLNDKVVLIGDEEGDDHISVLGEKTPGVMLHANYVQSLLEQRIFLPAPFPVTFALFIAWFAYTNWRFWKARPGNRFGPEYAVAETTFALLVLFLISLIYAREFHRLIPVWWEGGVSLGYIVLHWVESRAHHTSE
jgi:CHASE2 domain-containing sensor protein